MDGNVCFVIYFCKIEVSMIFILCTIIIKKESSYISLSVNKVGSLLVCCTPRVNRFIFSERLSLIFFLTRQKLNLNYNINSKIKTKQRNNSLSDQPQEDLHTQMVKPQKIALHRTKNRTTFYH